MNKSLHLHAMYYRTSSDLRRQTSGYQVVPRFFVSNPFVSVSKSDPKKTTSEGIQVLPMKLMPVYSPKHVGFRNMVRVTKQRGMTPTKRLYENLFGNRCLQCPHTCRVIMLEVAVCVEMETC
ncbi:MAG: hypothetical protein HDR88_12795 [Bacteroides sp.]|nr:hypothetical protein [Bacteroides sp.]